MSTQCYSAGVITLDDLSPLAAVELLSIGAVCQRAASLYRGDTVTGRSDDPRWGAESAVSLANWIGRGPPLVRARLSHLRLPSVHRIKVGPTVETQSEHLGCLAFRRSVIPEHQSIDLFE